jgi:hypothetical protein
MQACPSAALTKLEILLTIIKTINKYAKHIRGSKSSLAEISHDLIWFIIVQ